ncbi:MAG: hypothetical protein ACI9OJ_003889, partial [Myxococcota bacterium]
MRQLAKLRTAIEQAVKAAGEAKPVSPKVTAEVVRVADELPEITQDDADRVVERYGSKQRKTAPSLFK